MFEKGINKAELSRGAEIPYTTIDGMWKKGTDNIKRSTLIKLARYFKCSLDYIADDEIETNKPIKPTCTASSSDEFLHLITTTEFNHIKKYRALDERGKETVDIVLNSQYELIEAKKETCGLSDEEIEKELESYKQELLAEQKGKTLSASTNSKGA